jgi:hypothetical protein
MNRIPGSGVEKYSAGVLTGIFSITSEGGGSTGI